MPPQNSGHHVLEGEATLTQFNRPVLFSDHVLRLRKLELKGFHICGDVVIILKKYRSFLWLFGGLVFAGPLSGGRFLSASLLIIIIIITVLSPHPIKLLCMENRWSETACPNSGVHAVTACVFCPPGCRSVPDNVTTEGGEHRTASS